MLTKQTMFDKTCRVLHAQGGPSIREDGKCLYRGPEGRRCNAGIHITDEEYVPEMDDDQGTGIFQIENRGLLPSRLSPFVAFLSHLQDCHDEAAQVSWKSGAQFWPLVKSRLYTVAEDHSLDASVLDDLN